MLKLKNLLINLLIVILIVLVSDLTFITQAKAVTQNFQWTGSTGYCAKATFTYDETTATKIISEQGAGRTNQLKSLIVTFYTPAGETIHQYENVVNGETRGNYFEFNFDTATQKLFGNIDLGGELSGELFLKGTVNQQLSLIEIEPSGEEHLIDTDAVVSFAAEKN
ncbi:hypothetical protein Sta7437_3480 [Stanieria cyanosphaera PCC 7437]|uniref:Uncharacterized protein n=1 Tax=Stanieria cyanosphaera (strain ATCC 29371 / PCC 7437) TaxID=111780 RepID=K9XY02_STAC7|nr:hypothetical protein Sta7437_3480 [Stanieria cyanosphaera PCC 7437]